MLITEQMTTLEKKIQHFSRILAARPGDELTMLALAEASFRRGLKLEALTAYQELGSSRPVPEAHLAVAEIYSAQGMPHEAYGELRRLFALDPENVEARLLVNVLQEEALPPEDLRELMEHPTSDEAFDEARLRLKIQRTIYNRELQERTRNVTLEPGTVIHEYHMEEAKKKLIRVDELLRELERFRDYNQSLSVAPPRAETVSARVEEEATAEGEDFSAPLDLPSLELDAADTPPVIDELPQEMLASAEPTQADDELSAELPMESSLEATFASEPLLIEDSLPQPSDLPEPSSTDDSSEWSADNAEIAVEAAPDLEAPLETHGVTMLEPDHGAEDEPSLALRSNQEFEAVEDLGGQLTDDGAESAPDSTSDTPAFSETSSESPSTLEIDAVVDPGQPASGELAAEPLQLGVEMGPIAIAAIEPIHAQHSFTTDFGFPVESPLAPDLPDDIGDEGPSSFEEPARESIDDSASELELPIVASTPTMVDLAPIDMLGTAEPAMAPSFEDSPSRDLPQPTFDDAPVVRQPVAPPAVAVEVIPMVDDSTMILTAPPEGLAHPTVESPAAVADAPVGRPFTSGDAAEAPAGLSAARKSFYDNHSEALSALTTTLARTRGVTSIYLVAREGVTIDSVAKDDISEKRIGELVKESFEFLEAFASDPAYWVLECAGGIFVMQKLDERHVLIAIGQAGANFGALRYTMDKTRTKFEQLLTQAPE